MPKLDKRRVIAAAIEARLQAVAPFSGFHVGAALLAETGKIFTGANVESASYGLTCCAERVALFKALTEGERQFLGIAIVGRIAGGPMPCGACRQLLAEYAPNSIVWIVDSGKPQTARTFTVGDLLPKPFLLSDALQTRFRLK